MEFPINKNEKFWIKSFISLVEFEIKHIETYIESNELLIKNGIIELDKDIADMTKNMSADEKSEYYDFRGDEYFMISDRFPEILRNSIAIYIYSYLENELLSACRLLEKYKDIKLTIDDSQNIKFGSHDIIGNCRKYLTTKALLNLTSTDAEWNEIRKFQKVRNTIVHNNSIINIKDENTINKMRAFLSPGPIGSIDNSNRIILTEKFAFNFSTCIKTFLTTLYSEIYNQW